MNPPVVEPGGTEVNSISPYQSRPILGNGCQADRFASADVTSSRPNADSHRAIFISLPDDCRFSFAILRSASSDLMLRASCLNRVTKSPSCVSPWSQYSYFQAAEAAPGSCGPPAPPAWGWEVEILQTDRRLAGRLTTPDAVLHRPQCSVTRQTPKPASVLITVQIICSFEDTLVSPACVLGQNRDPVRRPFFNSLSRPRPATCCQIGSSTRPTLH